MSTKKITKEEEEEEVVVGVVVDSVPPKKMIEEAVVREGVVVDDLLPAPKKKITRIHLKYKGRYITTLNGDPLSPSLKASIMNELFLMFKLEHSKEKLHRSYESCKKHNMCSGDIAADGAPRYAFWTVAFAIQIFPRTPRSTCCTMPSVMMPSHCQGMNLPIGNSTKHRDPRPCEWIQAP